MTDKMASIVCIWRATRRTLEEESKKKMLRWKMTVKVNTQEETALWALGNKAGTRANKSGDRYFIDLISLLI